MLQHCPAIYSLVVFYAGVTFSGKIKRGYMIVKNNKNYNKNYERKVNK